MCVIYVSVCVEHIYIYTCIYICRHKMYNIHVHNMCIYVYIYIYRVGAP